MRDDREPIPDEGEPVIRFRSDAIRCPVCHGYPGRIYRCDRCGEVRCGMLDCRGSFHVGPGWAGSGSQCRHCGAGHYRILNCASREMDEFLYEYRQFKLSLDEDPVTEMAPVKPPAAVATSGFRKYQMPEFGQQ
ncbi:MAG: hypothetical protein H7833_03955 [Magnetococcus sp. DMHC-1]|nr:transposase [Magnetococcales bacterium]